MNTATYTKMLIWLLAWLLLGCQPSDTPSTAPFVVTEKQVILHKGHLLAVKTELYTPSFALQGLILPKQEHNITLADDGKISKLLVQKNEQVTKGQVLAYFHKKQLTTTLVTDDNPDGEQEGGVPIVRLTSHISYGSAQPITAPIGGKISQLYDGQGVFGQGNVLMTISDDSLYHFVSVLPARFDKYIEVGDHVNFSLTDDEQTQQFDFAGQVAKTVLNDDKSQLLVTVHIIPDGNTPLTKGLRASGWITYGDLSVGAVVPTDAFADGVNLHALTRPPYKPATPTPAHVWVVRQDGTLSLVPVHIVAYKPLEARYLVTGISDDSLIVSANLPTKAQGMAVKVR